MPDSQIVRCDHCGATENGQTGMRCTHCDWGRFGAVGAEEPVSRSVCRPVRVFTQPWIGDRGLPEDWPTTYVDEADFRTLEAALVAIRDFAWDGPIMPRENPTTERMRRLAREALEAIR